jgi:hypothetical protein
LDNMIFVDKMMIPRHLSREFMLLIVVKMNKLIGQHEFPAQAVDYAAVRSTLAMHVPLEWRGGTDERLACEGSIRPETSWRNCSRIPHQSNRREAR